MQRNAMGTATGLFARHFDIVITGNGTARGHFGKQETWIAKIIERHN